MPTTQKQGLTDHQMQTFISLTKQANGEQLNAMKARLHEEALVRLGAILFELKRDIEELKKDLYDLRIKVSHV